MGTKKLNISSTGQDQFDNIEHMERAQKMSPFQLLDAQPFSIGSFIKNAVVVYKYIQDGVSWGGGGGFPIGPIPNDHNELSLQDYTKNGKTQNRYNSPEQRSVHTFMMSQVINLIFNRFFSKSSELLQIPVM